MAIAARHKTALNYAKAGLPVFPCHPGTKKPATPHGFRDATTNVAQINEWWSKADYNVAICPEDCGWAVIDTEADASPEFIAKLPETFTVATPRGGRHFYYEGSLPSSVQKLGPRIDTRGQGGYVLVPPSVVNGNSYRVINAAEIGELPTWVQLPDKIKPVAESPAFILDDPRNIARAITHLKRLPTVQEKSGADAATYRVACDLRDLGLSGDKAFELMLEHYKCEPKDARYNGFIQTKIQNAYEYATNAVGAHAAQLKNSPAVQAAQAAQTQSRIVSKWASEIRPEKLDWMWHHRFPRGKLSLLAGDAKLGKTTVLLDMAARISRGRDWPDGAKSTLGEVIYFSAEDDPADTLIPRLMAVDADLTKIRLVECVRKLDDDGLKTFDLAADMAELDKLLNEMPNTRLVVFDPISSYFGRADTYRNSEVRSILEPLVRVAMNHRIAIIGNTHLAKNSKDKKASHRVMDSVAITATVRAGYMVVADADDARRRLFLPLNGNLGPPVDGLSFVIDSKFVNGEGVVGSFAKWDTSAVTTTIEEAVQQEDAARTNPSPQLDEACEFLKSFLGEGQKQSIEVWHGAEAAGLKIPTVKRAIKKLGVISEKKSLAAGWLMRLP